jgi:hypothetical protein
MPPPTLRSLCLCRLEEEKHCKEDLPLQIVEELRRRRIASHRIQRLLSKWVAVVRRWAAHVGPTMTSFDLQVRYLDGTEIWYTTHSDHTSYVFLESGLQHVAMSRSRLIKRLEQIEQSSVSIYVYPYPTPQSSVSIYVYPYPTPQSVILYLWGLLQLL